jgi:hypothetical protein
MAILRRKSRNRRQVVSSIAALKALTGMADGQAAQVMGYDSAADGGADVMRFNAASSASDDGGTVHRPTAGPPATGNGRWISVQPMKMDARKFGVIPGLAATTLTSRLNNALAVAKAKFAGSLHLLAGNYDLNGPILCDDVIMIGEGEWDTNLNCTAQLGSGVPFIELHQSSGIRNRSQLRDLRVWGPGTRCLGVKTAKCNGIKICQDTRLDRVRVSLFDVGIIIDSHPPESLPGHVRLHACFSGDNYYGIYWTKPGLQGGDFNISDSDINGNTFANLAWSGNWLMPGFTYKVGHCGYAPFAVYQEATTDATQQAFCSGMVFDSVTFENMGNMAIYCANWNGTGNSGLVDNLVLNQVGMSRWAAQYGIPAEPHSNAVKLGPVRGVFKHIAPASAFFGETTTDPAYYFRSALGHIDIDNSAAQGSQATGVEIGDGNYENVRYVPRDWPQFNSQINIDTTSTTVNLHYLGPVGSLRPHLIPVTNGGLTGAFNLYVDQATIASNAATDTTSFTVRVAGGTPSSALKFRISFV